MSDELRALIAALPGNVLTADAAATHIELDSGLLRGAGFDDNIGDHHHWLDAVNADDLVDGALVWTPAAPSSAVSTSAPTIKAARGQEYQLRILVVPVRSAGRSEYSWVGTLFHAQDPPAAAEHVALALLERIAAIGGCGGARPATIAPFSASKAGRRRPPVMGRPLAIITGCEMEDTERLHHLLEIFGWRTVVADWITTDLAEAAEILFVRQLSDVPDDIIKPYTDHPTVIVIHHLAENIQIGVIPDGCRYLSSPIAIDDVELLIGEIRNLAS